MGDTYDYYQRPHRMTPARENLRAYRGVPFVEMFPIQGVDLTGATIRMQIRLYPDAPGDPEVDLAAAAPGVQGVSLAVSTTDGIPTSTIRIDIYEGVINDLPSFSIDEHELGDQISLAYDIVIAAGAYGKRRWFEGAFIIVPGVTK